jgi:YfiH family protein
VEFIVPNWHAPSNVKALASTRVEGFSAAPYNGLNVGMHVGDNPAKVSKNRQYLEREAQMPSSPIWLNQTHSTTVLTALSPTDTVLNGDAIFTRASGVVCSAMTADCLPVLLTNTQGSEVAAVHAGWRGLAAGIVENAVELFSGEVMAWLGPAIGSQAFEVGDDVVQAFVDFDHHAITAFEPKADAGKWWANMEHLATLRLAKLGVTCVAKSGLCTYQDPTRFYSYRRDGVTGRQASFIWLD